MSETLRVVRRSSRAPTCSSSFRTLRLTAERPTPRRSAARAKLPSSTTEMKAMTWVKLVENRVDSGLVLSVVGRQWFDMIRASALTPPREMLCWRLQWVLTGTLEPDGTARYLTVSTEKDFPMPDPADDASRRRTRRRPDDLRQQILEAAGEVFLRDGYANTSLDAVIERVGGSKRAIYSHFGSKDDLLAAMLIDISEQVLRTIPETDEATHDDVRASLTHVANAVMRALMDPRTVALYRLVVAEGVRRPELAETFLRSGPGRAAAALAKLAERSSLPAPAEIRHVEVSYDGKGDKRHAFYYAWETIPAR